jgi:putative N-acetylmannosamine-6-phosphate epimerase
MTTVSLIIAAFTIGTAITVIKEMAAMFSSVVEVFSALFL